MMKIKHTNGMREPRKYRQRGGGGGGRGGGGIDIMTFLF